MSDTTQTLAAHFGHSTFSLCSETPLAEDQMRRAALSIFAADKRIGRSAYHARIPSKWFVCTNVRDGIGPASTDGCRAAAVRGVGLRWQDGRRQRGREAPR